MTASDLAHVLSVTPTAVWNWEKQGVHPRPRALDALAKALGVTTAYLLTGVGHPSPSATETAADVTSVGAAKAAFKKAIAKANGVSIDHVVVEFRILDPGKSTE